MYNTPYVVMSSMQSQDTENNQETSILADEIVMALL